MAAQLAPINIGIVGLGTVGAGTLTVLTRNAVEITRRAGRELRVTRASVRDLSRSRDVDTGDIELGDDSHAIVRDPDIDIVCELIGGTTLAKELVLEAISNGKHVVTANKALIAVHGNEIFSAAQKAGVVVAFEAAVAGGIPIIKAIREGLAGNQLNSLAGIINGTGNFILTEMRDKGRDFDDVLKEAQELGYAEADPTFDVEGIDAAHKLTILASIAFGIPLQFEKVFTEGIGNVSQEDVRYAEELGYRIKHIGIARRSEAGVELRVHPTLLPERALLANVNGVMNAVHVEADAVGPTLHYGAGAGAEPTASAVVADLVDVVRTITSDPMHRVPHLAFQPDAMADMPIADISEVETGYYLRLTVYDNPGVLADIAGIFGERGISIEAIIQREPAANESMAKVIMLTRKVRESEMDGAIEDIKALSAVSGPVSRLRVEHII